MDRTQTINRIYRMLEHLPPEWQEQSEYVTHAMDDIFTCPLIEELSLLVEQLLDDRWGSLARLDREDIVHALDHIQRLALE
jgi:hypothetical protein